MTDLEKYGSHKQVHGPWGGPCHGAPCRCGFNAAIESARNAVPVTDLPAALEPLQTALAKAERERDDSVAAHKGTHGMLAAAQVRLQAVESALAATAEALKAIESIEAADAIAVHHFRVVSIIRSALSKLP